MANQEAPQVDFSQVETTAIALEMIPPFELK
jgi:hypothetical protein